MSWRVPTLSSNNRAYIEQRLQEPDAPKIPVDRFVDTILHRYLVDLADQFDRLMEPSPLQPGQKLYVQPLGEAGGSVAILCRVDAAERSIAIEALRIVWRYSAAGH